MSSNATTLKTTSRDAEFMYCVIQHMEGKPNVNWEGVATALNYKSGAVAAVRFRQIKKSMDASTSGTGDASNGSSAKNTTPTKAAPKPKPSKVTKTPTGKSRGRSSKAAAALTTKKESKKEDDSMETVKCKVIEEADMTDGTEHEHELEHEHTKEEDYSGIDYNMLDKEALLNGHTDQKYEDVEYNEEDYLVLHDGESNDGGDAEDIVQ